MNGSQAPDAGSPPLLAIVCGIGLMFLVSDDPAHWRPLVIEGLVAGLASCGLYDAATAARKSVPTIIDREQQ